MNKCKAFQMEDANEAYKHITSNYEIIKKYTDENYNHKLHTWDEGYRLLGRCKECDALILNQTSEFHSFTDDSDDLYNDYFPIESEQEAEELNEKYNGFEIEKNFNKKWLSITNNKSSWHNN